ncbi:MAG: TolC family protein, partial [Pyrinomonadaceae bacterium]|nr:TolC family protein [Pyrinomonadaceae bacterium]
RNAIGLEAVEPLRLKGNFENMLGGVPSLPIAKEQAVLNRPDLEALRHTLALGNAQLEKSRSEARPDAGVSLGFQRMTRVAPIVSNQNPVELSPNLVGENFLTFGVDLMLPVRNRNQGNIEAAALNIQAAQKRLDFGELSVRREVTSAYARYEYAVRALTIYRAGVRNQAKQNLNVIWQTYEFGDKALLDYIGEERRYLELENALIDAELAVYLARIEILEAANASELIRK